MRQIGFKNFRRFEDFPSIDLAPITIFVGENNAGKSTVVKAILSILDFVSSQYFSMERNPRGKDILNQRFYFNKSYFAHIGTFKRALYNKALDGIITLSMTLDDIKYVIEIIGDSKDDEAISGKVVKLTMTILRWNIDIEFNFEEDRINAFFHNEPHPLYEIEEDVADMPRSRRKASRKELEEYFKSVPSDAELTTSISGYSGMIGGPLIECLLYRFTTKIEATVEKNDASEKGKVNDRPKKIEGLSDTMLNFLVKNKEIFSRFGLLGMPFSYRLMQKSSIEYIYAHAVTQTIIYSAKDINDYFVKTVHEYANQKISKDSKIHEFVTHWMEEFCIGSDYELQSVGGEAHIVKIISKDKTSVNLADKGMGSIQLMILLFRLATKMSEMRFDYRPLSNSGVTIIVEEPEQNLHPMLQSKLTDLFYKLNQEFGFKFIIETHSEYLVRRSQVVVANENKKAAAEQKAWSNPFKVFYFPAEGYPYDMEYATDGYFERPFGKGFFNVSSELSLDLDRIEQGVYNER